MSMTKIYKENSTKTKLGPGGIKCNCCSNYHCHPRKSKPLMRRVTRRVMKQALKKEINK